MSKFIVFEGIDGSGKSTQIDLTIKKLIESKVEYSLLREPGTTQISEKIRADKEIIFPLEIREDSINPFLLSEIS